MSSSGPSEQHTQTTHSDRSITAGRELQYRIYIYGSDSNSIRINLFQKLTEQLKHGLGYLLQEEDWLDLRDQTQLFLGKSESKSELQEKTRRS